jgi:hypothetical protein
MEHEHSTFLTLTYDDEHLPKTEEGLPTLQPRDLQLFLKRYRKVMPKIRFFAVGEYGDQSARPHYHLAVFGGVPCSSGIGSSNFSRSCCPSCDTTRAVWGLGLTHQGLLTVQSARYIAGYVTKKMTAADDPRLNGRHPEFARMSNRPGIGAFFCDEIASAYLAKSLDTDIGYTLKHGNKDWPLGRYLRKRINERVGRPTGASDEVIQAARDEMSELYEAAQNDRIRCEDLAYTIKRKIFEKYEGKLASLQYKEQLYNKKASI